MRCIRCAAKCEFAKRVCEACKAIASRNKRRAPLKPDGPSRTKSNGYELAQTVYRPRVIFASSIRDDNEDMLAACPWLR